MDATFGAISDPQVLAHQLKMIPGVVETGFFLGLTGMVYIGTISGVEKIEMKRK
jgi:ribose 5-phosphate isomerase